MPRLTKQRAFEMAIRARLVTRHRLSTLSELERIVAAGCLALGRSAYDATEFVCHLRDLEARNEQARLGG